MSAAAGGRHLSTRALHEHWDSGVPVVIPLAGDPALRLRIDKPRSRLTLRAPVSPQTVAPTNHLAHVRISITVEGGSRFLEIATTDERLLLDGYAMLSAIADRIQIDGLDPLVALEQTLATWRSILSMRVRMTQRAEVGLAGELLVLESLLAAKGDPAVAAWRGGLSEEHDFGFKDADVEVKTTSSERRQHWIHGLGQLLQTGATPLWLLSVQITRGGDESGRTLPQVVDDVQASIDAADSRARFNIVLTASGWRDDERDLFSDTWQLRSIPLPLRVDDSFPHLTAKALSDSGVDVGAIRQVDYEIDVTNRKPSDPLVESVAAIVDQMRGSLDV